MRVVFDTNILVSALVIGGRAGEAMARVIEGRGRLIISPAIVDELLTVLARKFSRDREQLARVAIFFDSVAERVIPAETLAILTDEPDNRILECAVAGSAEAIVTGDRAMLALGRYQEIEILTLKHYLETD